MYKKLIIWRNETSCEALHKNKTFIQVFSSTNTYGAFFFSLDTEHKNWGVVKLENGLLHWLYKLVLGHKTVMTKRKAHRVSRASANAELKMT